MATYTAEISVGVDFTIDFEADSQEQADEMAEAAAQEVHDTMDFPNSVQVEGGEVQVSYSGPNFITVDQEPYTDEEVEAEG